MRAISRRLIVFLRSRRLRFIRHGLIVRVGRFISIVDDVFAVIVHFRDRIYVLPCCIGVLVHDFSRRFVPASLVFLQIGVAICYSQYGVGLRQRHDHVVRHPNVMRRMGRSFFASYRLIHSSARQVNRSSRTIAFQDVRVLCLRASIVAIHVTRGCGRIFVDLRQGANQVIWGAVQVHFVDPQLGVEVQMYFGFARARLQLVFAFGRMVDRVLGRQRLTLLGIDLDGSHF